MYAWAILSRYQERLWLGACLILQQEHILIVICCQVSCPLLFLFLLIGKPFQETELQKRQRMSSLSPSIYGKVLAKQDNEIYQIAIT